jgi:diaminohydroxyphosphoribosylaminopyrimidine deaminase/5-amino-6-(5-phosphoribosylamino)uracil reductase
MERAIDLARKGTFTSSPNPSVGCVIVEDNKILSESFHLKAGSDHAEIIALKKIKKKINKNMVMFVTLEPCCHRGKTGPCTKAIIESGIKKVVVSMLDPNPKVKGKGVKELRSSGIKVEVGLCREKSKNINLGFIYRFVKKRPYILAKQAVSLDLKITNPSSRWISSKKSREDVHYLRARSCAILVGSNTVSIDNPRLTVRINNKINIGSKSRAPVRVVLDTKLSLNINKYNFFKGKERKIVFNCLSNHSNKEKNIDFVKVKKDKSGLNLKSIMKILAEKYEINYLMVEPGKKLFTNLLIKNLLDEIVVYKSPIFIGDSGLSFISSIKGGFKENVINTESITKISNDVKIVYKILRK